MTINLRWLEKRKTVPLHTHMIGGQTQFIKKTISTTLQYQVVEKIGYKFIETEWFDIPTVIVDLDV